MNDPAPPNNRPAGRILLTLAGLAAIAALGSLPTLIGPPTESGLLDLAKFTGRFHPVVLHLPIGIIVWVLVHECLAVFGVKNGSSRTAIGLAAGSAVVASLLGILLYYSMPEYDAELAERHMDRGIAFTCLALATWLVKIWVDAAGGRGTLIYRILLLGSVGLMGIASHDGGSLTHGSAYLTEHAPAPLRKLMGLPEKSTSGTTSGGNADPVIYRQVIAPIFEGKCYACHNVDKQKGKYRMDDYDLLLAGGKEGKKGIVPGDAAASNVIVRIELPEDDDDHMPPEGKKDLEPHELVLVKWWIDQGAQPEAKLSELAATDEIMEALAKFVPESAPEPKAAPKEDLSDAQKAEIQRLQAEFPAALNQEYQGSGTLTFTAMGLRGKFGDDHLAKLQSLMPAMVSVDLSNTTITDGGARILASAGKLRSLRLAETAITDASLESLSGLTQLESLNLYGTQVTGRGVMALTKLTGLRKLYLWQTQVDEESLQTLREKLPDCEIVTGI